MLVVVLDVLVVLTGIVLRWGTISVESSGICIPDDNNNVRIGYAVLFVLLLLLLLLVLLLVLG